MDALRSVRRLTDLDIVSRGQWQVAGNASAAMLRPRPLVSMRQKHHKPGEEAPFRLTHRDELVHDDLSAVRKITQLCLPNHQRLRIVAREAILEAKHCG